MKEKTYTVELTKEELLVTAGIMLMQSTGFHVPVHASKMKNVHTAAEKLSMLNIHSMIEPRATDDLTNRAK